ncbi:MAG: hypothetical protein RL238_3398 [Actinomycetota bacterium]
MAEEFEGDLVDAVFWGADLSGATFRDVNLTGVRISHAWLVDVEIDALVERMVVNGVDVTDYVNQHDPWYPLRTMLRPATPADMRTTWAALEAEWADTIAEAVALPGDGASRSVNDEFSFVQTVQHLVFAIDKWFTVPVLGAGFDPIGLPNRGSLDFWEPHLDYSLTPTLAEALAVRADRGARFRAFVDTVAEADLDREVDVMENGPHPLRECLYTVFEEEFWHLRYARRDLAIVQAG